MEEENVMDKHKKLFYEQTSHLLKSCNNDVLSVKNYKTLILEVKTAASKKSCGASLKSLDYRRLKKYALIEIGGKELLVTPNNELNIRQYIEYESMFDAIHKAHADTGHKRRLAVEKELSNKYKNIPRAAIVTYLKLCQHCQLKKKHKSKGLVVRPILTKDFNSRCQVDLIDYQSEADGEYKFVMNYQCHLTKFCILRALKTKTAAEVAENVVDIFCIFGAPNILHSDNGKEFVNHLLQQLTILWPGLKLVRGKPRHSQSQGSVERANQDVRELISTWMAENKTKQWSSALKYVQFQKNRSFHRGINRPPYEALFGHQAKVGLRDTVLSATNIASLECEDDLVELLSNDQNTDVANIDVDVTVETQSTPLEISTNIPPRNVSRPIAVVCDVDEIIADLEYYDGSEDPQTFDTNFHASHAENKKCELCYGVNLYLNDKNVCEICVNKNDIAKQREAAASSLKRQAEEMLCKSNKKFKSCNAGQNVVIKIPDVDRSRASPRNILAVVMNENDDNLYTLGTKQGVLDKLYCRNEFEVADSNFLTMQDIDDTTSVTLRGAAAIACNSKQGFNFCLCKKKCTTKACKCRRLGILCNSKCHNSDTCTNK